MLRVALPANTDEQAFRAILTYIYTDSWRTTTSELLDIIRLSQQYRITDDAQMKRWLSALVVTRANLCDCILLAQDYNHSELSRACLTVFAANHQQVSPTQHDATRVTQ
jgi:hypothetical protein